jgi:hypothetical protein
VKCSTRGGESDRRKTSEALDHDRSRRTGGDDLDSASSDSEKCGIDLSEAARREHGTQHAQPESTTAWHGVRQLTRSDDH